MTDRDDISAPPEPDPNEDPKDVIIRNLLLKVHRLQAEIARLRSNESWRANPDRTGS